MKTTRLGVQHMSHQQQQAELREEFGLPECCSVVKVARGYAHSLAIVRGFGGAHAQEQNPSARSTDTTLIALGWNRNGQLGLGHTMPVSKAIAVPFFDGREVLDVACGERHSMVLCAPRRSPHTDSSRRAPAPKNELFVFGDFQLCSTPTDKEDKEKLSDSSDSQARAQDRPKPVLSLPAPKRAKTEDQCETSDKGAVGGSSCASDTAEQRTRSVASEMDSQVGNRSKQVLSLPLPKRAKPEAHCSARSNTNSPTRKVDSSICASAESTYSRGIIPDGGMASEHLASSSTTSPSHPRPTTSSSSTKVQTTSTHDSTAPWRHSNAILEPFEVPEELLIGNIVRISSGWSHNVVITSLGLAYTFGLGLYGSLGHGSMDNEVAPRRIEYLEGIRIVDAACGIWHTLFLSDAGGVYSCGFNKHGQLGLSSESNAKSSSTPPASMSTPEMVDFPAIGVETSGSSHSPEEEISRIYCGARHSVAVTNGGSVYAWGWNGFGQIHTEPRGSEASNMDDIVEAPLRVFHSQSPKNGSRLSVEVEHWSTVLLTD